MKHNDYWKERFLQIEATSNQDSLEYFNQVKEQFRNTDKILDTKIRSWYQRLAVNNNVSMQGARKLLKANELEEFKWNVKEYIEFGKANSIDGQWMKELENASAKYHISHFEALKIDTQQTLEVLYGNQLDAVDKLIRKAYTDTYYHSAFELQKGFNIGFDIASIDNNKLTKIISKPWVPDGKNFSERIWSNKKKLINELHTELTQMCILGKSPDKAISNIAKKMNTSKQNAGKLVMTESAFFSSVAQKDCFNNLEVEKYEIVATLDSLTSATCQELDGKVCDMKDFIAGSTAPPFHVWCRTCTVPWFDDDFTIGQRAARDEDGKVYYVSGDTKYKDWKKTFIDGGSKDDYTPFDEENTTNPLKESNSDVIIKKKEFKQASTILEADDFAKTTLGVSNVSYKGVDLVTANAWNEGLKDSFDRFPKLKNNFGFVGEAHERNNMLKPIVKEHILDDLFKKNLGFSDADIECYADKQVRNVMKTLQVSKNTYAQSWSPTLAPYSSFRGVSVNREMGKNSTEFIKNLLNDVKSKYHPTGCETIRSVLDHEIGHQLDELLDIRSNKEIQGLFDSRTHEELTDALSRYSWDNENKNRYSEMIAEAWAEYCNSPKPREIAKTIGTTIEKEYLNKFDKK